MMAFQHRNSDKGRASKMSDAGGYVLGAVLGVFIWWVFYTHFGALGVVGSVPTAYFVGTCLGHFFNWME